MLREAEKGQPRSPERAAAAAEFYRTLDEMNAVAEKDRRFRAWEAGVKANPDLIPPFAIEERLAIYASRSGGAKVEALKALGDRTGLEERIDALYAERKELNKQFFRLTVKSPEFPAVAERSQRLDDEIVRLQRRLHLPPSADAIARAIGTDRGKRVELGIAPADIANMRVERLDPKLSEAVEKGAEWIRKVVGGAGWGPQSVPVGKVTNPLDDRAHCNEYGIAMDDESGPSVFVHEFGHWIEFKTGAGPAAREFLKHRVGNEPSVPLNVAVPGSKYKPDEKGRKDRFEEVFGERSAWYVGKDYGTSPISEIVPMGIQKLYEDPAGFAAKDPEYAAFIVGILDGSLR